MPHKSTEIATCDISVDVGKALKRPSRAKFTPAKRKQFLQEFAKHFNFTKAAQVVGIHRVNIYQLLQTDSDFAAAFQQVKDAYLDTVEEASITVALRPDARGFNDRRLMLEAHRKDIYGRNPEIALQINVNNLQATGELAAALARIPQNATSEK